MPRKSAQIEVLKKKQEQLKMQIQSLEAAEKSRERKRELQRKILVGSYYLEKIMAENKLDELKQSMNQYLTRKADRVLFDLDPIT